ncbi:hypothetical protein SteCoe_14560 [Stentor coeruleus]|uniref:Uncharacterized protein n=1 Tax=Stentor coeruleus TaxID=5963 RepID=A0A1R2C5X5_9CILI|nr:hypothetical protein SteCoe_14560 [Stentor coeruleus]
MFWTSCFYVTIALISLYIISTFKSSQPKRNVYTRIELLKNSKFSEKPKDWTPMPKIMTNTTIQNPTPQQKIQTLESFILKEVENSVKELEQKRIPFSNLDNNVLVNRLNPLVDEFLPKIHLNPLAQDFHPSSW